MTVVSTISPGRTRPEFAHDRGRRWRGWPSGPLPRSVVPRPWPRLAALAHVRPASCYDHLSNRPPAALARLAVAAVDEELLLEGALSPVEVAEVIDARALC